MPRYHLHPVTAIGASPDEEGGEYADLAAAQDAAVAGIRSLIAEDARTGVIDLAGRIDISGPDQRVLLTVAFLEAIEFRRAP